MDEAKAVEAWQLEKPIYAAWGDFLTLAIRAKLMTLTHEPIDELLKIPAIPRVKSDDSFRVKVQKKLGADKSIDTIDDRVGVRFVVLLTEQIELVKRAVEELGHPFTKDRDYETEREARPLEFAYQSVHLVVRPAVPVEHNGVTIPAGLACEVQIRTLLQHAHSELTHDRLYKARNTPPQGLNRSVARSMALIEATDNIFAEVAKDLAVAEKKLRELVEHLDDLYEELLGVKPGQARYSAMVVGELLDGGIEDARAKATALFHDKPYLVDNIRERLPNGEVLYETSAVLFAYLCLVESPDTTRKHWPLTDPELEVLGSDLGISFER
jgi:ppGpp synthetase/RelA/SpoT-type nucleotidyltranferase